MHDLYFLSSWNLYEVNTLIFTIPSVDADLLRVPSMPIAKRPNLTEKEISRKLHLERPPQE